MDTAEAKREYYRRYREKNRERIRETKRAWVEANPEKVKQHYQNFYRKIAEQYSNEN